jgi:hypothetical protein
MRIKRPAIILTTLLFFSFTIIATLAFFSKNINEKKNGFNRRLVNTVLKPLKQIEFPAAINRMIGSRNGKMFFQGNPPYEIYITDDRLDSLKTITLPLSPDTKISSGIRMFLQGAHIYISCRNLPGIIDYNLDSGNYYQYNLPYFYSKDVNISEDQFILRTRDLQSKDPVFVKLTLNNKGSRVEDHFSEKRGESGFPTDGILYYDSATRQACYTYFYQNGFICMDTNLNITVKARTIDTITKRELKIARVGSFSTMKQPPQFVNYIGSVSAGKLYLQSMLKADNEFPLDFSENTVVDVYDLSNGNYNASFYIPSQNGKRPFQFDVNDKKLYAIYGKQVVVYELNSIQDL